jgi:hypothetical protein
MSNTTGIHLGFEVGTGRAVEIPLRHTAVTGQTQESGKTTTLEGLISRSGLSAIAYVTKRGESSFHVANPIPPYFQERADWQFVQSLLEAAMATKMDFKQPWIMRVSDGARTLDDVRANLRRFIDGVPAPAPQSTKKRKSQAEQKKRWLQKPATGLSLDVYYVLDKYFEQVMPQIKSLPYSTKLDLARGLNVMDLRDYDFAVQALVIRSVTDRIRQHEEKTINIIPEAWKFAPKQRGSPVRLAAEEYVRESAAMKNFLWIDSQDLAGVADVIMRQVGVWIFGVQRAIHEIDRALDHMPEGLPGRRPRPADIATLGKGQFYACFGREMYKVYVQPAWMSAAHAEAIARGEEEVDSAREILTRFDKARPAPPQMVQIQTKKEKPEDPVWEEKYKALKVEFDQLREAHDAMALQLTSLETAGGPPGTRAVETTRRANHNPTAGNPGAVAVAGAPSLNDIFIYVRERLKKDPAILQVLQEQPELRVKVDRPVIETSSKNLKGCVAILITEKFFAQPRDLPDVKKEMVRRGWLTSKAPFQQVSQALAAVNEMGFLTSEETGYQAVDGAKIKVMEASA